MYPVIPDGMENFVQDYKVNAFEADKDFYSYC